MADPTDARPIEILLIEDNPGDVELTLEALEDARITNRVTTFNDGEAALAYLQRSLTGAELRPDLILLDFNLPKMDGREVLEELKGHQDLRRIPVIVLTTSSAERDVLKAYELHANSYITKPLAAPDFIRAIQGLEQYWLTIVRLPPR
jgi:two-component system, chemotaxis family, response regulator Rcp1